MNKHALFCGICAGLLLAAGTASAGTCTAEIEALQKTLAITGTTANADATQGTSIQQGTNSTITADSATGATPAPVPDVNGTDASGGVMAQGNTGAGGQPAQTAPLDSDVPQSGGAQAGQTAAAIDPDAASQSLAKARILAQAGDEAGCMQQVNQAKSQLGLQ